MKRTAAWSLAAAGSLLVAVMVDCGGKVLGTTAEAGSPEGGGGGASGFSGGAGGSSGVGGGNGSTGSGGSGGHGRGAGSGGTSGSILPEASPPVDASGLFPPSCESCLASSCTAQYTACLADTACVAVIECFDKCRATGVESARLCAIGCAADASSTAGGQGISLLLCMEKACGGGVCKFSSSLEGGGG